jgi:hypothetical protein
VYLHFCRRSMGCALVARNAVVSSAAAPGKQGQLPEVRGKCVVYLDSFLWRAFNFLIVFSSS